MDIFCAAYRMDYYHIWLVTPKYGKRNLQGRQPHVLKRIDQLDHTIVHLEQ